MLIHVVYTKQTLTQTKCAIGEVLLIVSINDFAPPKLLQPKPKINFNISVHHGFWIHFWGVQLTALLFIFKPSPLLFSKASFTLVELCWEPSTWVLPHSCSHLSWETSCHTETLTHSTMAIRDKLTISFTWHVRALCTFKECLHHNSTALLDMVQIRRKTVVRDVMLERTYCRHSMQLEAQTTIRNETWNLTRGTMKQAKRVK